MVSLLPIKPFTAAKAARVWKMCLPEAQRVLEKLASRAILVDIDQNGETEYVLPPPMAGFFEFSMMRIRSGVDQKVLGELFYEYLNVEEDFIKDLFTLGETQLGRVFVHEPVLSNKNAIHILDYERASEVIRTASHMGVGTCYCRHKMLHVGRACDNPLDNKVLFSHRALAAVLGVILKLPPIKQIMATQQVKSRYFEALISYFEHDLTPKNCN